MENNLYKSENSKLQSVDNDPCTGDQLADSEKMIRWLARSYGLKDAAYHEAYNRELHRQARSIMC